MRSLGQLHERSQRCAERRPSARSQLTPEPGMPKLERVPGDRHELIGHHRVRARAGERALARAGRAVEDEALTIHDDARGVQRDTPDQWKAATERRAQGGLDGKGGATVAAENAVPGRDIEVRLEIAVVHLDEFPADADLGRARSARPPSDLQGPAAQADPEGSSAGSRLPATRFLAHAADGETLGGAELAIGPGLHADASEQDPHAGLRSSRARLACRTKDSPTASGSPCSRTAAAGQNGKDAIGSPRASRTSLAWSATAVAAARR